ncbi:MAG: hypothetical protein R3A48_16280 [Polyangiales bacterium]
MEVVLGLALLAVMVPLGIWFGDESAGRAGWRRELHVQERFDLGEGAFRVARVEQERVEVLRERAPWWVRLLALTCYLPLGAAILAALPWILGVLMLTEGRTGNGLERQANAMLVIAFPFGCWAAKRMASLGRALLSGDGETFRAQLRRTAALEVALNASLLFGAAAIFVRFHHHRDALALFVTPTLTLLHLALVAVVGEWQTRGAQAPSPRPEARDDAPLPHG